MAETGKIAKNLERFAQAVAAHDRENPTHTAWGIGLAHFDMERLGLEEGEEILPGITMHADGGQSANFRVLCDGQHDEGAVEREEEVVEAVSTQALPAGARESISDGPDVLVWRRQPPPAMLDVLPVRLRSHAASGIHHPSTPIPPSIDSRALSSPREL